MAGPIATASVAIEVDDAGLDRNLVRSIERAVNRAARAVTDAGRRLADAVTRPLERAGSEAALEFGNDLARGMRVAGDRAADALEAQFEQLHLPGIDPPSFAAVRAATDAAGEAVEDSFREASRGANEDLRDIGGAGTYTGATVGAEVAGERIESSFREASRASSAALRAIGVGLALAATAGVAAATKVVGFGIQQAASLEQTKIGFEALLGSAEKAQAFIDEMFQFAARTPFEFQGLSNTARQLLAVGENAGITLDNLLPTVAILGDLASVLGAPQESLDLVTRALAQMAGKGRVASEELFQITEALPGFNALEAISSQLGITTAELSELIEKGALPAKEGIRALIQGMKEFPGAAGAMAKQAETLNGLFSTFKDTISITLTDAFEPLIPQIKDTLARATPIIGSALEAIAPALSDLTSQVISGVVGLIQIAGPALGTFLTGLSSAVEALAPVGSAVVSTLANGLAGLGPLLAQAAIGLAPFVEAVVQLANVSGPVIEDVLGTLLDALTPIVRVLSGLLINVANSAIPAFSDLAPSVEDVTDALDGLGTELSDLLPVLQDFASNTIVDTILTFTEGLALLADTIRVLTPVVGAVIASFKFLGTELGPVSAVVRYLGRVLTDSLNPMSPYLKAIRTIGFVAQATVNVLVGFARFLVTVWDLSVSAAGAVVDGFLTALNGIALAAGFVWNSVLVPFGRFMATVFAPEIEAFSTAWGIASDAVEAIGGVLSDFYDNQLVPTGRFLEDVFSGAVEGAGDGLEALGGFAEDVAGAFDDFYDNSLVPLGSYLADVFTDAVEDLTGVIGAFYTNALLPTGRFLRGVFTPVLEALGDAVSFVSDNWKTLLAVLAGIATPVLGPLRVAFFLIGGAIRGIGDAIDFVMPAIEAVGGFLTTIYNDVILPIAGAVGGAFAFAFRQLGGAFEAVLGSVDDLSRAFGVFYDDVVVPLANVLGGALSAAFQALEGPARAVAGALAAVGGALGDALGAVGGVLVDVLGGALSQAIESASDAFTTLREEIINPIVGLLGGLVRQAIIDLGDAFRTFRDEILAPIVDLVGGAFSTIWTDLVDIWNGSVHPALTALGGAFQFVWDIISPLLLPALKLIAIIAAGPLLAALGAIVAILYVLAAALYAVQFVVLAVTTTFRIMGDIASFVWNSILVPLGNFLAGAFTSAVRGVGAVFQFVGGVVSAVARFLSRVGEVASPLVDLFRSGLASAVRIAAGSFGSLLGAIGGVAGALGRLLELITRVADALKSVTTGTVGKNFIKNAKASGVDFGASGGIFDRATPLIIGEAGREVLIPLTRPARARQLAEESGLYSVLGRATPGGGGGEAQIITFGQGAIAVTFTGAVPTPSQARSVGKNIGRGISTTLAKRGVRNAALSS